MIICTSVAVLTWTSVLKESGDPKIAKVDDFDPFSPPFLNLLKAYGIISFQFDIHPMLLTIAVDMQNRREIGRAVFSGLLTTLSLSIVTTILVSGTYGQGITSNVLQSLPRSWELYAIIGLVTVQLCLSNAVGSSALFQHIEDILKIPRGWHINYIEKHILTWLRSPSSDFNFRRCIVRSVLVWLNILIGEFIPKFDIVMGEFHSWLNCHTIYLFFNFSHFFNQIMFLLLHQA